MSVSCDASCTSRGILTCFYAADKQLPSDEEGGIRLPNSPVPGDDDEDVSMLDTQIPGAARPKRPKRKGCCVCCGLEYA